MLWQCLKIERSTLYDQDQKTYYHHRNTCGSISRFAVIICLFCGIRRRSSFFHLKDKGIERDPENDMGGRIGFIENGEKIQFASRINGYYGLFTRV